MFHDAAHRVLIASDIFIRIISPDVAGTDKWQQVKICLIARLTEGDLFRKPVKLSNKIYTFLFKNSAAKIQTFRRIMVAANHQQTGTSAGQFGNKPVQYRYCLSRRNRFVIQIARDDNRVRLFIIDDTENLLENITLIFQK